MVCPTFLRQTFVEWAGSTIPRPFWASAYYERQRDKGCSHQAALRALAYKWIRIVYRCWQTHTPYDESPCLHALNRRGSPLIATVSVAAQSAWRTTSGREAVLPAMQAGYSGTRFVTAPKPGSPASASAGLRTAARLFFIRCVYRKCAAAHLVYWTKPLRGSRGFGSLQ